MNPILNKECLTCSCIARCNEVTPEKVLSHYVCVNYQEVKELEKVQARYEIITKFGESGMNALFNPDNEET